MLNRRGLLTGLLGTAAAAMVPLPKVAEVAPGLLTVMWDSEKTYFFTDMAIWSEQGAQWVRWSDDGPDPTDWSPQALARGDA